MMTFWPIPIFLFCALLNLGKLSRQYKFYEILIHPIVFLTVYFGIFFFIPAYTKNFHIPAIFESLVFTERNISSVIYLVLFTYSIITFYFLIRKRQRKLETQQRRKQDIAKTANSFILGNYIFLYILFLFFILMLLVQKFGGFGAVLSNYPVFYMKARQGSTGLLMILYSVELLPVIYLMFAKRCNILFFSLIFVYSLLMVCFTGARTLIVCILLQVYFVMIIKRKINLKVSLLLFVSIASIFIATSWLRAGFGFKDIESSVTDFRKFLNRNTDQFLNSLLVVKKIENGTLELQKGKTFVDAVYFFIPHRFWPEKPISYYPSRIVYGETAAKSGQTFNFGMIGRPYLDFGAFGVVISNILLFIIFLRMFEKLISKRNDVIHQTGKIQFSLRDLIFVYIYSHILQVYMLGMLSHIWPIFLLNIILWVFFFMGYRVFSSFIKGAVKRERYN